MNNICNILNIYCKAPVDITKLSLEIAPYKLSIIIFIIKKLT